MKRYLHVGFSFNSALTPARLEQLEAVFDKGVDWMRYANNCWVVCTNKNADGWFHRLKPLLRDEERVLIVEIVPAESQGLLSEDLWDWLNQAR